MDETNILNELGRLRTGVFSAMKDLRIELVDKIDENSKEQKTQFDRLMNEGCFQGRLDRKDIADLKAFVSSGSSSENDSKKRVAIGFGRYKFAVGGFKASDVVLIIFGAALFFLVINQQRMIARMDTAEKTITHRQGQLDKESRTAGNG